MKWAITSAFTILSKDIVKTIIALLMGTGFVILLRMGTCLGRHVIRLLIVVILIRYLTIQMVFFSQMYLIRSGTSWILEIQLAVICLPRDRQIVCGQSFFLNAADCCRMSAVPSVVKT